MDSGRLTRRWPPSTVEHRPDSRALADSSPGAHVRNAPTPQPCCCHGALPLPWLNDSGYAIGSASFVTRHAGLSHHAGAAEFVEEPGPAPVPLQHMFTQPRGSTSASLDPADIRSASVHAPAASASRSSDTYVVTDGACSKCRRRAASNSSIAPRARASSTTRSTTGPMSGHPGSTSSAFRCCQANVDHGRTHLYELSEGTFAPSSLWGAGL